MNQQDIQFCTLKQEDAEEIKDIIIKANLNTFPLLIHKYQTLESFEQQTSELIYNCFKSQQQYRHILNQQIKYNFGLRVKGRLVAVMLSIEMVEQYKFIKLLFGINQYETAFKHFNLETLTVGTTVYFTRLSVLPQMMGKGLGKRLVYQSAKYLLEHGYKESIMGSIVEVSRKMFMGLGGELMRHEQAIRPNFTYQINIIKNNFKKLIEIYESSLLQE